MTQSIKQLNLFGVSSDTEDNQLLGANPSDLQKITSDLSYLGEGDLGRGFFAKRLIKPGELILAFSGPIIGFQEAVDKGERECWPLQIGKDQYLDLEEPGCYVNHSCNPNSGIRHNQFLIAIREIQKDAEIRYDYSTTVDEDHWKMDCRCNNPNCRHIISDFKYLNPMLRAHCLSLGIVQKFISDQYQHG